MVAATAAAADAIEGILPALRGRGGHAGGRAPSCRGVASCFRAAPSVEQPLDPPALHLPGRRASLARSYGDFLCGAGRKLCGAEPAESGRHHTAFAAAGKGASRGGGGAQSGEAAEPPDPRAMFKRPLLSTKPRIRLLYQTPEVYMTDVGEQLKPKLLGWRYACRRPDEDGFGEKAIPPYLHPAITFNAPVRNIHVHLKDKATGKVYWDADFVLKQGLGSILSSKTKLSSSQLPTNPVAGAFHMPCVRRDDPVEHMFDLSISSRDGVYEADGVTPWGDMEGFKNFRGPKAHIGFSIQRMPELEQDLEGNFKEILGEWRPGGSYSTGIAHNAQERLLLGEEDPFYDPKTGDTHRLYYDYIIKPSGRKLNRYAYIDRLKGPLIYHPPPWVLK